MKLNYDLKIENAFYAKMFNDCATFTIGGYAMTPKIFHLVDSDRTVSRTLLTHETLEFSIIEFGKVEYLMSDGTIQLEKGGVVAIPAGVPHTWRVVDRPFLISGFQVLVNADYKAKTKLAEALEGRRFHFRSLPEFKDAVGVFRLESKVFDAYSKDKIASKTWELLVEFLRQVAPYRPSIPDERFSARQRTSLMKDFIGSNLRVPLRISDVAHYVNLAPRHAARLFKEATGISMGEYILNARIDEAAVIMSTTEMSVKEVAAEMGFETNYFCRIFKRRTSRSPSEFRMVKRSVQVDQF